MDWILDGKFDQFSCFLGRMLRAEYAKNLFADDSAIAWLQLSPIAIITDGKFEAPMFEAPAGTAYFCEIECVDFHFPSPLEVLRLGIDIFNALYAQIFVFCLNNLSRLISGFCNDLLWNFYIVDIERFHKVAMFHCLSPVPVGRGRLYRVEARQS